MKIMLTGSNGLLGQKLVHALCGSEDLELIATSRGENRLRLKEGYKYYPLDITREQDVIDLCLALKPEVIIHTAAMTQVDECEDKQAECWQLNVTAVDHLIRACEATNTHLVHLSTDFIFDGADGPYDETAEPNPLSFYGKSKLAAEKLLLDSTISWSILRTVLVYGVAEDMSRSNIVLWAKSALEKGQALRIVSDQFRSPTLAEDLAEGCILAAKHRAQGIYNISGRDQMSVLELVKRVAAYFNLPTDQISEVSSAELNQRARRPLVTGFKLEKAQRELGYEARSFEEGIALVMSQVGQ
ncbi:MAG: SDR family oxidoreductase [Bacteroidia bacterium]